MTDTNTILRRLESANTVPSIETLPGGALSSADLLARAEQGISALKEAGPISYSVDWHQPTKRAYGPVIAIAAAAALLVAFGLLASLTPPGDVGQGDEPPPTTTLAPVAVEAATPNSGLTWRQITPGGIDSMSSESFLIGAGDRFLQIDGSNGTVGTSFDGINWAISPVQHDFTQHELAAECAAGWQDIIIAYGCDFDRPDVDDRDHVDVIHADGTVATHDFDADIAAVGIGPHGMVVIAFSLHDEHGLKYLDPDAIWDIVDDEFQTADIIEGVLHAEFMDGSVGQYVLADYGYADSEAPASVWFSQDGETWSSLHDFPTPFDPDDLGTVEIEWQLVGTADGFAATSTRRDVRYDDDLFVRDDPEVVVWHSPNGVEWQELDLLSEEVETLSRWNEGAILSSHGESLSHASGSGIEVIPRPPSGFGEGIASSQIGIVIITKWVFDDETSIALYSPDGQTWIDTSPPIEMRESLLDMGWSSGAPSGLAATHDVVLVRVEVAHTGTFGSEFVWFLGTPVSG